MKIQDITGLVEAYGFQKQFERPEENKTRFSGNGTFLDVWYGKKGLTVGVYKPKFGAMGFRRNLDLSRLEDILIASKKEAEE